MTARSSGALQHQRDWWKTRYAQRLGDGICVLCGEPARTEKAMCQTCQDKQTVRIGVARNRQKMRSVEYLGGKCTDCGLCSEYVEVYDFHHKNPEEKSMTIAGLMARTKRWEKIREELDKCVLLCANCHRIRHAKEDNATP